MNRNPYCNKFLFFILISISFGKILNPISGLNSSELLEKDNKSREYYEIDKNGLEYSIKGPAEVKIFSKGAFPKKINNGLKHFNFNISIN